MSEEFLFFYGHTDDKQFACFSNWYHAPFTKNGIKFQNTEQYMMYSKALIMGDDEMAAKILKTPDPKTVKSLGRKVKNWDEEKWVAHREEIMYDGCLAKFSEPKNALMKDLLLSTATRYKHLVEASPYDNIWGIGLRATDERAKDQRQWKGLNLLGKTLDRVRDTIKH